jgi:hypothetical protein
VREKLAKLAKREKEIFQRKTPTKQIEEASTSKKLKVNLDSDEDKNIKIKNKNNRKDGEEKYESEQMIYSINPSFGKLTGIILIFCNTV